MATAKQTTFLTPRRRARRIALLVALAAVLALAWFWHPVTSYARTGAAYGARIGCSCRYIEGRGLADCRKDFEPGMDLVTLSEDSAAKSVTARFPLLATQTATFHEGAGCVLEKWRD
jgi:hypothetical protein